MTPLFLLTSRVIVVTGATGVLAGSAADYLAAQGAHVAYLGRNRERVDASVARSRERTPGAEVYGVVADVLDRDALEQARDEILARWGSIDGLLNGAGGNLAGATLPPESSIEDLDFAAFKQVVDLKIHGTCCSTKDEELL